MTRIKIDLEEMLVFYPVTVDRDLSYCPPEYHASIREREAPTMEIDDGWLVEFTTVSDKYHEMREQLEQLYRRQQGLALWDTPQITVLHHML